MVRVLATSLAVGVAAAGDGVTLLQSLSRMGDQLQSGDGVAVGVGAARLDATNRMVNTMVSLAQDPDVMDRVPEDVIQAFKDQSDAILEAIYDQNALDQDTLNSAADDVAACNTVMQSEFTTDGGIDYLNALVYGARNEHASCRGYEDDAVTMWQSLCDVAQDKSNTFYAAEPNCLGSTAAYIDKDEYLECTTGVGVWYTAHYSGFSAAVAKCDEQYDVKESFHGWCDNNQSHFETTYVAYATKLSDTCTAFDTCYTDMLAEHDRLKADTQLSEVSQVELYKAVKKLECLIAIFETATSSNLIAGDVENCLSQEVDASNLTIGYPLVAAPEPCDTTTASWNITEYANLNASHIEPAVDGIPGLDTGGGAGGAMTRATTAAPGGGGAMTRATTAAPGGGAMTRATTAAPGGGAMTRATTAAPYNPVAPTTRPTGGGAMTRATTLGPEYTTVTGPGAAATISTTRGPEWTTVTGPGAAKTTSTTHGPDWTTVTGPGAAGQLDTTRGPDYTTVTGPGAAMTKRTTLVPGR